MDQFDELFGRATKTQTTETSQPLRLRDWATQSPGIAQLVFLGPDCDGSSSLASANSSIWAAARSNREQQVILFLLLSYATLVLKRLNERGDGVDALLRAMNIVDGVPLFAPLLVAFRNAIGTMSEIEALEGRRDGLKRSEMLHESRKLEQQWGGMAGALLVKLGGRAFLGEG